MSKYTVFFNWLAYVQCSIFESPWNDLLFVNANFFFIIIQKYHSQVNEWYFFNWLSFTMLYSMFYAVKLPQPVRDFISCRLNLYLITLYCIEHTKLQYCGCQKIFCEIFLSKQWFWTQSKAMKSSHRFFRWTQIILTYLNFIWKHHNLAISDLNVQKTTIRLLN